MFNEEKYRQKLGMMQQVPRTKPISWGEKWFYEFEEEKIQHAASFLKKILKY